MKKTIRCSFAILLIIIFSSCAKGIYSQASTAAKDCYIGMTIQEFKKVAKGREKLENMGDGVTIFKMYDYSALYGSSVIVDTKFFYFNSDGKLVKIDGGILQDAPKQTINLNIKKN